MDIEKLLQEVEKRPAMYFGRNSIYCLRAFLDGYYFHDPSKEDSFSGFQDWIAERYKITTSQSWADIIHFFSQDESDALKVFFEEWKLFLSSK